MTSEWQRRSSVSFFVSRSFLFCFFNRRVFIFTGGGVASLRRKGPRTFASLLFVFFLFPGRMRDDDNVAHQETAQSAWAIEFYWVLLGFTGFYLVLLGFIRFYWVYSSVAGLIVGFIRFNLELPSFTGFHWV